MSRRLALVSGASGFVGRWVVRALRRRGLPVRAGVHSSGDRALFAGDDEVEAVTLDILDKRSVSNALDGADLVFHFAALLDPRAASRELFRVNGEGTRNVWECAAARNVEAALYCSTAAVYGLLSESGQPVCESAVPRAVEPYGRSKLSGESAAIEISQRAGLPTVILRPAAIFGPGQSTAFARALRNAAVSRLLLAEEFRGRMFSFVHVEDVAEAAAQVIESANQAVRIYNVAGEKPISFAEAFQAYRDALRRSARPLLRARFLALLSLAVQKAPGLSSFLYRQAGGRFAFRLWRPGFDVTYSSKTLLDSGFHFRWDNFQEVILSCIEE